jgi:ribosomal protein L24
MAAKIRKGDKVIVLNGRDKGRTGEVFEVRPDENKALVRGVNMVKRHQKQTQTRKAASSPRSRRSTCPTSRMSARTASRPAWASRFRPMARRYALPRAREQRSMADTAYVRACARSSTRESAAS